jgi:hypothetical protein
MFLQFLISLATQLPLFLVYLVGFILALFWFKQCPKASVFAILGIGFLLLNSVVMTAVQIWLPLFWRDNGGSSADLQGIFRLTTVLRSLIGAAGTLLLIFAVFSGRSGVAGRP